MDSDVVRPVLLAVLALTAVAVVAATITDVQEGGAIGIGTGSGGSEGPGEGTIPNRSEAGGGQSALGADEVGCVEELSNPLLQAGIWIGVGLFAAALWYRHNPIVAVGGVSALATVLIPLFLLLACRQSQEGGSAGSGAGSSNGSVQPGGNTGAPETVFTLPPWLVVLVGAVAVAIVVVTVSRSDALAGALGRIGGEHEIDEDEPVSMPDAAAVGRVAGRAADRIETGVDAENEVFRAWATMADYLDVERPASSTPAEFADAAVEAGIDREDVTELTELFEAVRYGGEEPTEERERRAVEALRRIEQTYADADVDGDRTWTADPGDGGERP